MRRLRLTEYQTVSGVRLEQHELDALRALVPSLAIAPAQGSNNRYDLTPGQHVGVLTIGDLGVEIRPKIPVDRLLFLASYTPRSVRWQPHDFSFGEDDDLYEATATIFVSQLRRALARGLLQGYRTTEESLPVVRGRILFDEQIRKRYLHVVPAEVRFDDFTVDIELNRLLRAAVRRLQRIPFRSPELKRALRRAEAVLQDVALVEYSRRNLPAIQYTRLNEHYRPAVELARLILSCGSVEAVAGSFVGTAFLLDMNKVFEDFVVTALREQLALDPKVFRQGSAHRLALDQEDRVRLHPDISWWEASGCVFVGDVKYKKTRAAEVPNADLYQMLAYLTATGLDEGLLIYAAGEDEPCSYRVRRTNKTIHVSTLDLSGSPLQILDGVGSLARVIAELRRRHSRVEPVPA